MHIALVAPLNIPVLAPFVEAEQRDAALRQSTGNGSAPGVIAAGLLRAGHRVSVITYRQGEPGLDLTGPDLSIIRVDFSRGVAKRVATRWSREISQLKREIESTGADVVHSHWAYEASLAAARTHLPMVATVRDAPLTVVRHYRSAMRMVRATMPYEFRVRGRRAIMTAPSPYLAQSWARQTRDAREIRVVPNIAPTDMGSVPRSQVGREPVILEISDDGKRKNVATLVRAFAIVRKLLPDAQLRLVGRGLGEGGQLATWARRNRIANGVSFIGSLTRQQIMDELSQATVHAHVAVEETFGNTLVEAMMAGVPIVGGGASGAVPWVLGEGSAGALTDVRDAGQVANALLNMLTSEELQASYAEAGRERARRLFSEASVISAYEQAYRDAIDGTT